MPHRHPPYLHTMSRILPLSFGLLLLPAVAIAVAETPPEEEAAVHAIRRVASNIQKNRDGTVRFIRFSNKMVTDEHLSHLPAFKQLDYLAVVTPTVSDTGLANIAGLTNLDTLFLSESGLSDKGMKAFAGLKKLEHLYLDGTGVTNAGLEQLAELNSLKTLSLQRLETSDRGLAKLSGLDKLVTLSLCDTKITDEGLRHISSLTQLRDLYLDRCLIDGSGLKHLQTLSKLETLSLSGTQVARVELDGLAQNKGLRRLLLLDTLIGRDEVNELRAQLPRVTCYVGSAEDDRKNALERFLAGEALRGPASGDAKQDPSPSLQAKEVLTPASKRFAVSKEEPNFQRHVIPMLGRLGCNGRTCHGSFQGRGGFRLSMFGYDFKADHDALSERIETGSPADSLILLKPTLQEDHEGGKRFEKDSWEYQLLHRWIESGAKGTADQPQKLARFEVEPNEIVFGAAGEKVQLRVMATWSDGTREDVTCLTRFQSNDDTVAEVTKDGMVESKSSGDTYVVCFYDNGVASTQVLMPVRGQGNLLGEKDIPTPTKIDELVVAKLSKLAIAPSELCRDEQFLRRVSLDLIGTLPAPAEVKAFVADKSSDKRARKIEELLETPAYAQWWAVRLSDLTGSNAQYLGSTDMNRPAADQWNQWLRRRLQENVGWDRIAAGIILAESRHAGQSYEEYAAEHSSYMRRSKPENFTALNNPMHYYWFRSNNQQPADRALSFGYVFLGVRLQCAQCHKHPFDQWSKQDFEKFTQFFTRVKAGVAPDARPAQMQLKTKLGVPKKLDTAALRRQMYMRVAAEGLPIPWNEIWIDPPRDKPQVAKLLGNKEFDLNQFEDPREPLMAWLVQEDNPYFSSTFVNRIWAHYFGVGIIDPPDDFNMANPPSNKALLNWLSLEFIASGYDIKWLHRTIANSRTYQLSWQNNETNRNDERNFSHARIRRLPAEVTIDAILRATANDDLAGEYATDVAKRKIGQHPISIQARGIDYSLLVFGKPLRTTNCDCERQMQPTLLQSLYVRNDHEVIGWLERKDGWLVQVANQLGESLASEIMGTVVVREKATREAPSPDLVDDLIKSAYLRTLSRLPNSDEVKVAKAHIAETENTVEGLRDLMWALLNAKEFLTNH